jgi:hypothetical protein
MNVFLPVELYLFIPRKELFKKSVLKQKYKILEKVQMTFCNQFLVELVDI